MLQTAGVGGISFRKEFHFNSRTCEKKALISEHSRGNSRVSLGNIDAFELGIGNVQNRPAIGEWARHCSAHLLWCSRQFSFALGADEFHDLAGKLDVFRRGYDELASAIRAVRDNVIHVFPGRKPSIAFRAFET